ncbi:MAG TPA: DedA family protein [Methylomirabilota bacterium]|jgi:membrane protein DedA with SNARE-associated domain
MATWTAGLDTLIHDRSLVHLGLFLAALIDATGLPFPGRALLVAAGATMATGWTGVLTMSLAAALGAVVGDHAWYAAGRLGAGDRITALYCRLSLASGRCERQARSRFERFGPLAIVIGRFVAGVRFVAAPLAGGGAIAYPRYLAYEILGALVWSGLLVALGYALGVPGRALMARYGRGPLLAVLIALALAPVVIVLVRLLRRRRHGRATASSAG